MANEDFGNKPFEKLTHPKIEPSPNRDEDDERALFLQEAFKPPARAENSRGFLLADQCSLPRIAMKKKKKIVPPPPPTPPRRSEESDEELFSIAMRNTIPLGGKGRAIIPAKKAVQRKDALEQTLSDYLAGKIEFAISSSDEYMEGSVVGMDPLIMGRLRQGQYSPEAHLDMHGQNAEQAFEGLRLFMQQAWYKGLHTVLIIPGRGKNSLAGYGILRQKLPYWLTHEPFKRIVLGFCTAQPHDGGPGSIYVLLRKSRKKGPIRWETAIWDSEDF